MNPGSSDDFSDWELVDPKTDKAPPAGARPHASLSARCVYGVGHLLGSAARGVYETNWVQKGIDSAVGMGSTYMLGPYYGPAIAMGVGFYNTDWTARSQAALKAENAAQREKIKMLELELQQLRENDDPLAHENVVLTPAADRDRQASISSLMLEAMAPDQKPKKPQRRNSAIY